MGCTPLIVERLHSSYSYIRDKGPVSKLSLVERLHCIRDKRTCLQIELYMYMEPLSRQCMDPPFAPFKGQVGVYMQCMGFSTRVVYAMKFMGFSTRETSC